MKLRKWRNLKRPQAGFTLIELLVVVLIVGILAAIAIPQYFKVVEKGKASEALAILDSLRGAQERYLASASAYCNGNPNAAMAGCPGWDLPPIGVAGLKYFATGAMVANAAPGWTITLTRTAPLPAVYGAYTVVYTVAPSAPPTFASSVPAARTDLMPQ